MTIQTQIPNTSKRPDVGSCAQDDHRLQVLHELNLLDTPREEAFDRLARLICYMFDVPVAFISLWKGTGSGTRHVSVRRPTRRIAGTPSAAIPLRAESGS